MSHTRNGSKNRNREYLEEIMKKLLKTTCAFAMASAAMAGSALADGHSVDWAAELGDHTGTDLRIQVINDPYTGPLAQMSS